MARRESHLAPPFPQEAGRRHFRIELRHQYNFGNGEAELRDARNVFFDAIQVGIVPTGFSVIELPMSLASMGDLALLQEIFSECSSRHPSQALELEFRGCYGTYSGWLSVASIASLLDLIPNQLHSLQFKYLRLVGDSGPLVRALGRQQRLKFLDLGIAISNDFNVVRLTDCLATLPDLTKIQFWFRGLYLSHLNSKVAVAVSLAQVAGLGSLNFKGLPRTLDLQPLFVALQNHNCLKEVWLDETPLSAAHVQYVGQMLRLNSSIQKMMLTLQRNVSAEPIFEALKINFTLKEWDGVFGPVRAEEAEVFLSVLESKNFTLETLPNYSCANATAQTKEIRRKINFCLALNKGFQRKKLMSPEQNSTVVDWVDVIHTARDRTDVIFYYLSINIPLLTGANIDCAALAGQVGVSSVENCQYQSQEQDQQQLSGGNKRQRSK
jgi:hypothetical protein